MKTKYDSLHAPDANPASVGKKVMTIVSLSSIALAKLQASCSLQWYCEAFEGVKHYKTCPDKCCSWTGQGSPSGMGCDYTPHPVTPAQCADGQWDVTCTLYA